MAASGFGGVDITGLDEEKASPAQSSEPSSPDHFGALPSSTPADSEDESMSGEYKEASSGFELPKTPTRLSGHKIAMDRDAIDLKKSE